MRPRGIGRGPIRAAMRQARYQRYYNRGSQANWEAMKADETEALSAMGEIAGFLLLAIAALLVTFVIGSVGVFHGFVMVVLTTPLWLLGLLFVKLSD